VPSLDGNWTTIHATVTVSRREVTMIVTLDPDNATMAVGWSIPDPRHTPPGVVVTSVLRMPDAARRRLNSGSNPDSQLSQRGSNPCSRRNARTSSRRPSEPSGSSGGRNARRRYGIARQSATGRETAV
jgi:hypothetical protein